MSAKPQLSYESQIERKLQRFLETQTAVFLDHKALAERCRESLDGEHDQVSYDVAKRIFQDVIEFETQFEDFEIEFWNYLTDTDNSRAAVDHLVVTEGFADHKEYFFAKIEKCVSILSEVITEAKALGLAWPFLEDLEDSLEQLFDASEDLIEIDVSRLRNGEVAELLRQIPPQRAAPLEVIATAQSIKQKIAVRFQSRIDDGSIGQAASALREILSDTHSELESSNCDPRVKKIFARCVAEISRDMGAFSPVQFGIYIGMANGFRDAIADELGTFLSRQVISALMQSDIFLRNFKAWEDYSREANKLNESDGISVLDGFRSAADHPLFDPDVRKALDGLKTDKREFGQAAKIDYAIFQSVANALSEVCRQVLRFISHSAKKLAALVGEVIGDGIKYTIGVVAVGWMLSYSGFLIKLSEQYKFFTWLKPVVEFVRLHTGL
jgi:CheY-like chemotaxis protein